MFLIARMANTLPLTPGPVGVADRVPLGLGHWVAPGYKGRILSL
jgi:hypothetical protein